MFNKISDFLKYHKYLESNHPRELNLHLKSHQHEVTAMPQIHTVN